MEAAREAGLRVTTISARTPDVIASAIEKISQMWSNALIILASPLMSGQAARIAEFALHLKLRAIFCRAPQLASGPNGAGDATSRAWSSGSEISYFSIAFLIAVCSSGASTIPMNSAVPWIW